MAIKKQETKQRKGGKIETHKAIQSRSLPGRHVSTGFLDPVLGAMMKQVCWHSRRSKAYRRLPEARMAGATVEETAFEDVNMWHLNCVALACRCNSSLFSDVGPLETIAENKKERNQQQSASSGC